jgi:hypothetical protein
MFARGTKASQCEKVCRLLDVRRYTDQPRYNSMLPLTFKDNSQEVGVPGSGGSSAVSNGVGSIVGRALVVSNDSAVANQIATGMERLSIAVVDLAFGEQVANLLDV